MQCAQYIGSGLMQYRRPHEHHDTRGAALCCAPLLQFGQQHLDRGNRFGIRNRVARLRFPKRVCIGHGL
ncbi:hypothetical protein DP49_2793 [Burkholderia pseudomallei]|nr:hypothetical protein DP49_2793 [Burkholderia pseudomallei]